MKLFRFLLPIVFVSCTASFCMKDPVLPELPQVEIRKPSLEVTADKYIVGESSGDIWIIARSNDPKMELTVTSDDIRFTFRDSEFGMTGRDIKVALYAFMFKPGVTADTGTIKIVAKNEAGEVSETITVEKRRLKVSESEIVFPSEGGFRKVTVDANIQYEVELSLCDEEYIDEKYSTNTYQTIWAHRRIPCDWCKTTLHGDELTIAVDPYAYDKPRWYGPEPRTVDVILSYYNNRGDKISTCINVTQNEFDWRTIERQALIEIYNKMGGRNWTRQKNWCTDAPLSEWEGIWLDEFGHVTEIGIEGNGVVGEIPSCIGDFTQLKQIKFGFNKITGTIPESIVNCVHLIELNLSSCQLSGPIPEVIYNSYYFPFSLQWLNIDDNNFSGPIPEGLTNLYKMTECFLDGNRLSGKIPEAVLEARWWHDFYMDQQEGYVLYK